MTLHRHFFRLASLSLIAALLAACGEDGGYVTETGAPPYTDPMVDPGHQTGPASISTPEPSPPPSSGKPWSAPSQSTTASAPSPNASKYPKAQPIPGKPGLVKSPFAPYAGEVDVAGLKSGQAAKCPYTGKIFIVP